MLLGREMKRTIFMLVGRDWFSPEPEMDMCSPLEAPRGRRIFIRLLL